MTDAEYVYIYALTDRSGGQIVYVGACADPAKRLAKHNQVGAQHNHRLRKLLGEGSKFAMNVLEVVPFPEGSNTWRGRESWWIAEMKRRGHPLCNATSRSLGRMRSKRETMQRYVTSRADRIESARRKFATYWKREIKTA